MDKEDFIRLFGLLSDIKADVAVIKSERKVDEKRVEDFDKRLRSVESIMHQMFGAKAVMCVVCSAIGAVMIVLIQWVLQRWFN